MTSQEQVLEIEAEDVGGTSPIASLLTTVFSQYGTGTFRFVARPRGAGPQRPARAVIGATFPATRPSLEDVGAQGAWIDIQRERFQELHQQLVRDGWRPAGHGAHWWSAIYQRPATADEKEQPA
jgi:hypothetical protein